MTIAELEKENQFLKEVIKEVRECTTEEFKNDLINNQGVDALYSNAYIIGCIIAAVAEKRNDYLKF